MEPLVDSWYAGAIDLPCSAAYEHCWKAFEYHRIISFSAGHPRQRSGFNPKMRGGAFMDFLVEEDLKR